jgi:hypothetical protein
MRVSIPFLVSGLKITNKTLEELVGKSWFVVELLIMSMLRLRGHGNESVIFL